MGVPPHRPVPADLDAGVTLARPTDPSAADVLARVRPEATEEDLQRLGKVATIGGLQGRIMTEFSSAGRVKWVSVGVRRRESLCQQALADAAEDFEARFGPKRQAQGGDDATRRCLEWSAREASISLCCAQHAAPDSSARWMLLTATKAFGDSISVEPFDAIP
jgi:hypothetical protein